ncbi:hypothetical protein [Mesorhizobium sp.]|uniref:hypothetical protein n=1 Tax=Mesorhizobium sp. TaxID=1871066 RepID=UPI0025C37C7C|nr:hypothetical protein [Mesorhizobium sp.]
MQPALFVAEVKVEMDESLVHLIGIAAPERPPVSHVVMSNEAFRKLLADGRQKLHRNAN